jgi:hypothetical protein
MSKGQSLVLAFAFGALLSPSPARSEDSDRALLASFCDAGNIHGKTCTRAKDYPNAPKRGCDVTLTGDPYRGRFVASGHPLLVVLYESGCEAHATDNGGSVLFEQAGGAWAFSSFQPGMQAGSCVTIAKDDRQDLLVCLNGHMGQGIMETGVARMKFTAPAHGVGLSVDMLLRAEESTGAFGANTVTCKEPPPRYFELDKLKAGPRPMTVSVEASWADAETFRTACGKGFARPQEAIGDLLPGDAWMPDDRIKRGTVVVDLATRKVTPQ